MSNKKNIKGNNSNNFQAEVVKGQAMTRADYYRIMEDRDRPMYDSIERKVSNHSNP